MYFPEEHTVVSLANLQIGENVKASVAALTMGVYSTLIQFGQINDAIKNVIIIDEAHKVTNFDIVEELLREIKEEYGGALWLSSQMPQDSRGHLGEC